MVTQYTCIVWHVIYITIIQLYLQHRFHVRWAYKHIFLLDSDVKNNHKYKRFCFAKFLSLLSRRQCYDECLLNPLSRLLSRTCREYCLISHCILQGVLPEYFSRITNITSVGPLMESGHKSYDTDSVNGQTPLRVQTSIWTYSFMMEIVTGIRNLFKVNVISIFSLYDSVFKHNSQYGHIADTYYKYSLS